MGSTRRFLRQYLRPRPDAIDEREIAYRRGEERLSATLYRPVGRDGPLPGWVLLHGLTYRGRSHASLRRYARAVAAGGAVVMVPDIPEWRALRIEPSVTVPTIRAAVLHLDAHEDTEPGRIAVMGFSFGATQALVAAADPELEGHLAGVASWGGYCDPGRTFRFALTGEHEWDGAVHRAEPDPYGRWIMASNYLTHVPGYETSGRVADALRELVLTAGRRNVPSRSMLADPLRARLRTALSRDDRRLYDLLAPPPETDRDDEGWVRAAHELADALAGAAVRVDPLIDPRAMLPDVPVRTLVAHGRDDRLVPYTESLHLRRHLPEDACVGCTITALFAHSGGTSPGLGVLGLGREVVRFGIVLRRILDLV
ncbi:MAG: dienelactone hydrolase family protein [Gemmatimonadota bacterium]